VNSPIEYSDKPVTPFGGMALMKRFIDQVGIREYLSELDLPQPGSNRGYTSAEILESFWLNIQRKEAVTRFRESLRIDLTKD
jgi:hypothetical protein